MIAISSYPVYLDVTQTVARAKSGIETVVTSIARALPTENLLVWEAGLFRVANRAELEKIGITNLRNTRQSTKAGKVKFMQGSTLVLPEIISDAQQIISLTEIINSRTIQVVAMVYDLLPLSNPDMFPDFVLEKFLKYIHFSERCDKVIFCSSDTKKNFELWEKFSNNSKVNLSGSLRSRSTVDLPSIHDLSKCRSKTKIPSNVNKEVRILQVGNFDPRKNLDFTLDVCTRIAVSGRKVKLDLVGGNSWKMETFFNDLNNLKKKNLDVSVKHNLPDDVLEKLWLTADLSVYFSHSEGFGLPISESLFRGIPVVCNSNLPAYKSNKSPHLWGVEPGNLDLAVKKTINALKHGRCTDVNARVRGRFVMEASWKNYGEQVLKLASQ